MTFFLGATCSRNSRDSFAIAKRSRFSLCSYRDELAGTQVLEFGCGFGVDGIFFAEHGADVTLRPRWATYRRFRTTSLVSKPSQPTLDGCVTCSTTT
jgi:hypothetical protein